MIDFLLLLIGGLAGGFVSGLTGFGVGLTAFPFWLAATSPAIAAQLAAAGGALGQLQTIHSIWPSVRWRNVGHFVIAGLFGVPLGTVLLPMIPDKQFKVGIGVFLVLFCSFLLISRGQWILRRNHPIGDLLVGFGGGVMAGVSGLSGPLPIIWASLHDWPRDQKRALFQVFNLTILLAMLTASAVAGLMTLDFLFAFALAIPGTVIGSQLGLTVYRRMDARGFDRLVLAILAASGAVLVANNI